MNPSSFGDVSSRFPNFSPINRRFLRRSGLSKPRLTKVRKQVNSQSCRDGGRSESNAGLDFNPFRPRVDIPNTFPNVSGAGGSGAGASLPSEFGFGGCENEAFVFRAKKSYSCGNLNVDEDIRKGVVEEMRNLKLENETKDSWDTRKSHGFAESVVSELPESMKNLNIKDFKDLTDREDARGSGFDSKSRDEKEFVFIAENVDSSVGSVMDNELPNDLKTKLKVGSVEEARDGGGSEYAYYKKEFAPNVSANAGSAFAGTSSHVVQDKLKNLNIRERGSPLFHDVSKSSSGEFVVKGEANGSMTAGGRVESDDPRYSTEQNHAAASEPLFSSGRMPFQAGQNPPVNKKPEKTAEFGFPSEQKETMKPVMEFGTPNPEGFLFSGSNPNSVKREAFRETKVKRRGKSKQTTKIQLNLGQDFAVTENVSHQDAEASESYSPMDVSPYHEIIRDTTQHVGESSMVSDTTFDLNTDNKSTDLPCTVSNASDEELFAPTQRMDINEMDVRFEIEKEKASESHSEKGAQPEDLSEDSISGAETESFKSAAEEMEEASSDSFVTAAETEVTSNLKFETQDSNDTRSFSNLEATSSVFTFSASSAAQGPASAMRRHNKKKTYAKLGLDFHNTNSNTVLPYASSSVEFTPVMGFESPSPASQDPIKDSFTLPRKPGHESWKEKAEEAKDEPNTAQKVCEKWRLRGNSAYTDGDLSKAEEYYTQGINSVSTGEASRSCRRALMLCYSNRAATRMSLGRIREALVDCMKSASIDPNFLRVQVRAANCHLALGEVEDALQYFKKCLQLGTDLCVDRKILIDASAGLQEAQKVSDCMHQSAVLMQLKASKDVEKALEMLSEALSISMYSETLLEMKAEALFMLQKYVDAVKLCEQTFDTAEKNLPPSERDNHLRISGCPEFQKTMNFRLWRYRIIFKCYFHSGKLEEAIASLENPGKLMNVTERDGDVNLESYIPLAASARELLHLKAAGNKAFQAGRHAEAVEHYTSALSCNVESRPFTAICFCNRAAAYKALNQITDAIADCNLAIVLDGNYSKAISRRATLFEMIRDYEQAANDIERLVSLLTKQIEEKGNHSRAFEGSVTLLVDDLRQARLRLSELWEKARKGLPLDMYLILGVEPTCSASNIRKAYRKAALRHHPDKAGQSLARNENGDDRLLKEIGEEVHRDADKLFKMIGEAYATLSDPEKRSQYDAEEETRNAHRKHGVYRAHADVRSYPFEKMDSTRRHWREAWRSYGSSGGRWAENTR